MKSPNSRESTAWIYLSDRTLMRSLNANKLNAQICNMQSMSVISRCDQYKVTIVMFMHLLPPNCNQLSWRDFWSAC